MSDDEEVVLRDGELHKYMQVNDLAGLHTSFANKESNSENKCNLKISHAFTQEEDGRILNLEFSQSAENIIYAIVKTGLLYPDHIIELENYLDVDSVKDVQTVKTIDLVNCSCLFASSSLLMFLKRKLTLLHCIGLTATAYFGYKVYTMVKLRYESHRFNGFTLAIEHLFSASKKSLSFILESEFLLRNKIVKDQQFYVPSNGWVNPNTNEGLKYSGLIVPELRKTLLSVYLDVMTIFDDLLQFMRRVLTLKPNFDVIQYNIEPLDEFYLLKQQCHLTPSTEDLKKLNNVYLVLQSECLKHIILCCVEGLWINKSYKTHNTIFARVNKGVNRFNKCANKLEFIYKNCMNKMENNSVIIRGSNVSKTGNTKDKVNIFVKNFLTKSDAHILSLLLDLRMINDWINEFEENNRDNEIDYSSKLTTTLHDRLQLMKSNLQSFINLYEVNCSILKSMSFTTPPDSSTAELNASNQILNSSKVTGIEVGRSDFSCAGEDEVLISLSNADVLMNVDKICEDDYEDQTLKKCLPKNILNELKLALKGKKEEWLEREKKATVNSEVTLDHLDFDNLLNLNNESSKKTGQLNGYSKSKLICVNDPCDFSKNNGNNSSDEDEECSLARYKSIIDATCCSADKTNSNAELNNQRETLSCEDIKDGSSKEVLHSPVVCQFITPNAFADQIKLAQKSFNLNVEEEFLDNCSSEEDSLEEL